MPELTPQTLIQRDDSQNPSTFFDEGIVVAQPETREFYQFNNTAAQLWTWIETPKTVDELTDLMAHYYGGTAEQYVQDVMEWLQDAHNKQLLK